jgi:iron-sulfur cluster repair protein YtfE (RIC family)
MAYTPIQSSDHLFEIEHFAKDYAAQRYEKEELLSAEIQNFMNQVGNVFSNTSSSQLGKLDDYNPALVLQYLRKSHRLYLNSTLCEIEQTLDWLALEIGSTSPYLKLMTLFLLDYRTQLTQHIQNEENQLFPLLDRLFAFGATDLSPEEINTIQSFQDGHHATEIDLLMLRRVLREYLGSGEHYSSFRVLLNRLKSLELDLHVHHQLEEEVLLPLALKKLG